MSSLFPLPQKLFLRVREKDLDRNRCRNSKYSRAVLVTALLTQIQEHLLTNYPFFFYFINIILVRIYLMNIMYNTT